jgi:release factor glutamine methyltransferase
MTRAEAQRQLAAQLEPRYGSGEAGSIARIVLEDAFGPVLGKDDLHHLFHAISPRLVAGEPVQYVLGMADFFGLRLEVGPAVLIPRQETEELVAWVLEDLKTKQLDAAAVLDIGLGSGCIALSLKRKMPHLQVWGMEKSPEALALAQRNAVRVLGENPPIQFLQGDILAESDWPPWPQFDCIVSNPPYIPPAEKRLMPEHVLAHEPHLALFTETDDALQFYRAIGRFAIQKLRPGGLLFLECNEFNAPEVAQMLSDMGFLQASLRKDLSGADRMIRLCRFFE